MRPSGQVSQVLDSKLNSGSSSGQETQLILLEKGLSSGQTSVGPFFFASSLNFLTDFRVAFPLSVKLSATSVLVNLTRTRHFLSSLS